MPVAIAAFMVATIFAIIARSMFQTWRPVVGGLFLVAMGACLGGAMSALPTLGNETVVSVIRVIQWTAGGIIMVGIVVAVRAIWKERRRR